MDTSIDGLKRRPSNKRRATNTVPRQMVGGGFGAPGRVRAQRPRNNGITTVSGATQTNSDVAVKNLKRQPNKVAKPPKSVKRRQSAVQNKRSLMIEEPQPESIKPSSLSQPNDLLLGIDDLAIDALINDDNLELDDIVEPVNLDDYANLGGSEPEYDMDFTSDDLKSKKKRAQKESEEDFFNLDETHDNNDSLLDEAEKKSKKPKKEKKKKKKHRIRNFFLFLIVLMAAAAIVLAVWGNDIISRLTGGKSGLWDTLWSFTGEAKEFQTDAEGRTNILVFGTEGYDMEGSTKDGGVHDGAQLTDSIMVISLDQKTKDVAMISLPRDLKVSGACMVGKVNEIFTCNNENGTNEDAGAQAMMEEIGTILGLDFQYYAHVNWASLENIVNSLGGITVVLDEDIADYYYTGITAKAGEPVELDGHQAIALARARHGTTGGDFTRGNSQQKILEGIINKVLENGVGLTEAFDLLNILGDNLRTNFSSDDIRAGVQIANGFDINNLRQVPLIDYANDVYYVDTAMIGGVSYVIPKAGEGRYKDIQDYVDRMLNSNPITREGAEIVILNATGKAGVAGAEEEELAAAGFEIGRVGDAPEGSCEAKYCIYKIHDGFEATEAALTERYGVETLGTDSLPVGVAAGVDYVVIIGQTDEGVE